MELRLQHESTGADRSTTGPERKINSRTPVELFMFTKYFVRGNINGANRKEQKFDSSRNVVNVENKSNII